MGRSGVLLLLAAEPLRARPEGVGGLPAAAAAVLRGEGGREAGVGAGLGPPRQSATAAAARAAEAVLPPLCLLEAERRAGAGGDVGAVLHGVAAAALLQPRGRHRLLEAVSGRARGGGAGAVRVAVEAGVGLAGAALGLGVEVVPVLEVLLGGAAVQHPLDDLAAGAPRAARGEAAPPAAWGHRVGPRTYLDERRHCADISTDNRHDTDSGETKSLTTVSAWSLLQGVETGDTTQKSDTAAAV